MAHFAAAEAVASWAPTRATVRAGVALMLLMVGAHRKSLLAAGGGVDRRTFSLLFGSSSRLSMRKHSERSCGAVEDILLYLSAGTSQRQGPKRTYW